MRRSPTISPRSRTPGKPRPREKKPPFPAPCDDRPVFRAWRETNEAQTLLLGSATQHSEVKTHVVRDGVPLVLKGQAQTELVLFVLQGDGLIATERAADTGWNVTTWSICLPAWRGRFRRQPACCCACPLPPACEGSRLHFRNAIDVSSSVSWRRPQSAWLVGVDVKQSKSECPGNRGSRRPMRHGPLSSQKEARKVTFWVPVARITTPQILMSQRNPLVINALQQLAPKDSNLD